VTAAGVGPALEAVGWLGQACFFVRFFVQWIASERAKRALTPAVFWRFSLVGTTLSCVYAWLGLGDVVFAAAYAFNVAIYGRNLMIARGGRGLDRRRVLALALLVAVAVAWALPRDPKVKAALAASSAWWVALGVGGLALWNGRFLLQWVLAERTGRAELTRSFFVVTLAAWALVFPYALHVGGAPLIAGFIPVPFLAIRNLMLLRGRSVVHRAPS
jgi:lipid-A-disaccharide synthase-like uncharacterized protein